MKEVESPVLHVDSDNWTVSSLSPSFGKFDPRPVDKLQAHGLTVQFINPAVGPESLAHQLAGCQILIAGTSPVDDDFMALAPQLRMIAKHGVGVENIDLAAAAKRKILVTNVPGAGSSAVAELVFGHMLAVARGIVRVDSQVRHGAWPTEIGFGLRGSTLGIIGTGRIGQAVGSIAEGFGMRIVAYDPYLSDAFAQSCAHYQSLSEVLRTADFVTLHVPLSDSTRHLIGRAELGIMKRTAILINASRGGIVDESALVESLITGGIAGAGLDVHESEPSTNQRLFELKNVTLTSHIGAYTHDSLARISDDTAENILRLVNGNRPEFVVNEFA